MKVLLAVFFLVSAMPAFGNGNSDPLCPKPGQKNKFAPACELVPKQWSLIVDDATDKATKGNTVDRAKSEAEIGYFVRYLRDDLVRCKKGPTFVGETEESLQKYERAYLRSIKKAKKVKRSAVKM
jgi:hypothetical protein